jgi:hypothetical protein
MPALVHTNSALQSGFALVSENAIEQMTGIVEVSMEFVARATSSRILSQFFVDAPPPIYPTCVRKQDLITQRLYMMSHDYSQSNGLLHIRATFVGAMANKRNNVIRFADRQSLIRRTGTNQEFFYFRNPEPPNNEVQYQHSNPYFYTYTPFVITYEYAEINDIASYTATTPLLSELRQLQEFGGTKKIHTPAGGWDFFTDVPYPRGFFENLMNDQYVGEEKLNKFLTPTVKTVVHRFIAL